jgi:GT2 family glycosyltransferase
MPDMHDPKPKYTAIIATFRRPASLDDVLFGLAGQTRPPAMVVVVDNDPEESARPVIDAWEASDRSLPVLYAAPGANLGPAGGWAFGVTEAQSRPDRGEFVAVFDDDDAIEVPNALEQLVDAMTSAATDVAAVGLRGACCNRRTARLHRSRSSETGSVDYLASGGAPLYRWSSVDEHGFFDPALFFGFEDLDLGLRLRAAGLRLLTIETDQTVSDSSPKRTAWREYFKTRALVTICRRHLGLGALFVTLARSLGGGLLLLVRDRQLSLASARCHGVADALRGRLGERGWAPTSNPSKR